MITKSELKKRQETADKVRYQLGEKAILNGRESDQNHSQYPPELRALARASSGLKHWGEEDSSEDIHLFYEYLDGSPCTDRMLDYTISIEKAVLALQNSGKDGLASKIEGKWKKVKEFADKADDTIPVFRQQFINGNIDENTFAKKVRTAVHSARGTALALGRSLEIVVEQQKENFESKLSAISSKAENINKTLEKGGQSGDKKLFPVWKIALQSFNYAINSNRILVRAKQADIYKWLSKDKETSEKNPYSGLKMPTENTWKSYIRQACKASDTDTELVRKEAEKNWLYKEQQFNTKKYGSERKQQKTVQRPYKS